MKTIDDYTPEELAKAIKYQVGGFAPQAIVQTLISAVRGIEDKATYEVEVDLLLNLAQAFLKVETE